MMGQDTPVLDDDYKVITTKTIPELVRQLESRGVRSRLNDKPYEGDHINPNVSEKLLKESPKEEVANYPP